MRKFSRYIYELMDLLGYSYDMIKKRQIMYSERDRLANRRQNQCTEVTTGGKGEGTALYYESDFDHMYITKGVIAADNPDPFIRLENMALFQTDRSETSPGYTRLKLVKAGGKGLYDEISQSLFESENGLYYLSSQFYIAWVIGELGQETRDTCIKRKEISGPSTPLTDKYSNTDNVYCFKCFCPGILEKWVTRHRRHGWPSQDTIDELSRLDGHVVPVGFKESLDMYREWRICYSLAELHLMRNLNETQLKVYILLKQLSKSVLKPFCKNLTSYLMKNVVFWISERKGIKEFDKDLLTDRLFDCLIYLRSCVIEKNLPSYMIPERNLLAGRLDIQGRQQLINLLSDLLHEGRRMLLRCDKIRDAMVVMHTTPDTLIELSEKRKKVESLVLLKMIIRCETQRPEMSVEEHNLLLSQNERYLAIDTHIDQLIKFDIHALRLEGRAAEEIKDMLYARLYYILS